MAKILVVDDEEILRDLVNDTLTLQGHECISAPNGPKGLEVLGRFDPDLIVSDYKMPGMTGLEFLKEVQKKRPGLPFVIMTAYGTIEMAVEAIKAGAHNFIEKPFQPEMLEHTVEHTLENQAIRDENKALKKQISKGFQFVGGGKEYVELQRIVDEVAPSNATVLISGESGVGKEVLARSIHLYSKRVAGPFVKINCAAMPENLIESELFGHEKGAFTGAFKTKKGKFELADGGTLLLDEIGEMPLVAQSKLLRVLQEREISRVGSDEELKVDVRVICTTNRDLEKEVETGNFREDLFYRLNVIPVKIPPLRDRQEDIPGLVDHFIEKINNANGFMVEGVDEDAMLLLKNYAWPGNIRQLENAMERAIVFGKVGLLREENFDLIQKPVKMSTEPSGGEMIQPGMTVAQAEQILILRTLDECEGNKTKASELLDISIRTLRNKLHEYGEFESRRKGN